MAVTTIKRPFEIVPAYNDSEFLASSTQTAQPNFVYYVEITVDSGETFIKRIPPDPDGNCYLNMVGFTRKYVKNDYPFGASDWTYMVNNSNGFTVNIGEEYGSTPTVYPGTDYYFLAWNAALTKKERALYRFPDYVCTTADGINLLNTWGSSIYAKSYQDLVAFFIQYDFPIDHVNIVTWNSSGLKNTIVLLNPLNSFPAVVGFNISPDSINDLVTKIPARVDSISFLPAFSGDEIYYDVTFSNATDTVEYTVRVYLYAACETMFTEQNLYYLNRKGAYDYQPFQGNHRDNFNIDKKFYQGLSSSFEASFETVSGSVATSGPNPLSINDRALNISYEEVLTLVSQPLTQAALNALKDMFTSPNIFLNIGFQDYVRYSNKDVNYQLKQELVEKIVTIEATLNAGITERRQSE